MPLSWIPVWLGVVLGTAQTAPATATQAAFDLAIPPSMTSEAPASAATPPEQKPARVHQQVDEYLDVDADTVHQDLLTDTLTFNSGVVAHYGLETVHADRLTVNRREMTAVATGHVRLDDPEGTVTADSIEFSWKLDGRRGKAENVVAHLANVTVQAARAEIAPERWDFYDVSGTSCRNDPPLFQLRSRHLTVIPERSGKAEKPSVYIFGHRVLTLPDRSFNLNPRTEGFNPPALSYRRGSGLGVSFRSGFLLTPETDLVVNYSAYPGSYPGYGALLTKSFLPPEKNAHIVTPRSELSERFTFGYLENIQVTKPEDEATFLRRPRQAVSVASLWNQGTSGRGGDDHYSKPLEGVYELGGLVGGVGLYGQARLQSIRRNSEPIQGRLLLAGSAALPSKTLAPNLSTLARLDTNLFVGPNYGWVRGMGGVVYRPVSQVTLAAGAYTAFDAGHSQFGIDQLYSKNGFVVRADFNLGPTKLSYMTKWDRSLGWFDREYSASQVVGCLEPFVLYRQHPGTYNIGIRFRLDEFYSLMRRRDFRRTKPATTTISPGLDGKP